MSSNKCPNCGAPGGGPAGCSSCGLGIDPKVAPHINTGPRDTGSNRPDVVRDCFPGDALVLAPDGLKRIDSITEGSVVLSLDVGGTVAPATVKRTVSHRPHPILRVVSSTKDFSFFATKRHPVLTHRGWVRVRDLRRGDVLSHVGSDGTPKEHSVMRVERTERIEPVYNLVVDGDHTYLVQGCVAHSFVYFRRLRTWANKVISLGREFGIPVSAQPATQLSTKAQV